MAVFQRVLFTFKRKFKRVLHWGPLSTIAVICTLLVIALRELPGWRPLTSTAGDEFLLLGMSLSVFYYFSIALLMDPGFVPLGWIASIVAEKKLSFCTRCHTLKAPRAHHCQLCGRCVKRMDHHCPWINNCVGYENERAFLLFLWTACNATLLTLTLFIRRLVYDSELRAAELLHALIYFDIKSLSTDTHIPWTVIASLVAGSLLCFWTTLGTGYLLTLQIACIACNRTTLESWTLEDWNAERALSALPALASPYDLGFKRNMLKKFECGLIRWMLPFLPLRHSDGMKWQVRDGCDQYILEEYQRAKRR